MTKPELTRVEAIYDAIAPTWDGRQGLVERVLMGQPMREAVAVHLAGDVLEIGTGTGPTLKLLAGNTQVTSFTGVDLSTGMLDQARERVAGLPFPVELRQMNAEHLDFPDATFDTVTGPLVICHPCVLCNTGMQRANKLMSGNVAGCAIRRLASASLISWLIVLGPSVIGWVPVVRSGMSIWASRIESAHACCLSQRAPGNESGHGTHYRR